MKPARIGVLLLLLAFMASPVQGQQSGQPRLLPENTGNVLEPEKIVREYYAAYIAFLKYDESQRRAKVKTENIIPNRTLDLNYVTQHFVDAYRKLRQANERATVPGEVGLLNYDPILCAQDFPENLDRASFVSVEKSKIDALVEVDLWGKKEGKPMLVKLKRQAGRWRIDAVRCLGHDFESLRHRIKK